MRSEFIPTEDRAAEEQDWAADLEEAAELAPWAAKIVEVEHGFMAFESLDYYEVWQRQQ